ncbi:hypothetical protein GLOTRDRAFT_133948 [Gloeophyllum trabeum ATCC 11539]|uniref:DUF6533 domain-containing protein n=1 Tax=Gloeophyllum trabeum (strain ATCC 11539 / FP-39264 / Madison 617) TaxID=670483 RepID=S7R7Q6_GLOTA|nr:uncharacterized protein GLOTRDRAFT_133948 [Gloeophyllum trabeum ATCC 11539]EPQ50395.1 hypothetical protein GLOTRDRAFT_133948 [Gloeophyllum trabeum ATCC 11539]
MGRFPINHAGGNSRTVHGVRSNVEPARWALRGGGCCIHAWGAVQHGNGAAARRRRRYADVWVGGGVAILGTTSGRERASTGRRLAVHSTATVLPEARSTRLGSDARERVRSGSRNKAHSPSQAPAAEASFDPHNSFKSRPSSENEKKFARFLQSIVHVTLVASSTIVIYDHLITLDQEIDLIWKASWTPGKVLFLTVSICADVPASPLFLPGSATGFLASPRFVIRAVPELDGARNSLRTRDVSFRGLVITPKVSRSARQRSSLSLRENRYYVLASVTFNNYVILQLRLYALYHLNRRVLVLMCGAFLVSAGTAAVIMGMVLARISAHSGLIPGLPFCIPVNVPSWFYTFWIPTLGFESLLCALALFRAFKDFRSRTSLFQSGRHIVKILIRDSVIYYLIMFATYFTNLIIFLTGNVGVLESGIGFAVTMSCVMGSRLCLNIRDVHHELEVSTASQQQQQQQQQQQHLTQPSFVSGGRSAYGTASRGTNIVVSSTYALTEFELVELRNLRAQGKV